MPLEDHEKRWFRAAESGDLSAMREQCSPLRSDRMRIAVDQTDLGERTAMHHAAEHGHVDVLGWLLSEGGNAIVVDSMGRHPLHAAASAGHTLAIRMLIDVGNAALEARDRSGCTPLWLAVSADHVPAVQLLLGLGASPNVADTGLTTPLHKAAAGGKVETARLLVDSGGRIDAKDARGHSVIAHANERVRDLIWFHSAARGDVPRLRHMLAQIIGADGDEGAQANTRGRRRTGGKGSGGVAASAASAASATSAASAASAASAVARVRVAIAGTRMPAALRAIACSHHRAAIIAH
jgi:hypothetical protein